jgi:hypothetical protein
MTGRAADATPRAPSRPLVPTLCVGTRGRDALRPGESKEATQSVAPVGSHAERGNQEMDQEMDQEMIFLH